MEKRVAVFTRTPCLGEVKTRLAAATDPSTALACHVQLAEAVLGRLARSQDFVSELWLAGEPNGLSKRWRDTFGLRQQLQGDGDLGAKMSRAFAAGVSVIVGTDIPDLDAGYVQTALERLAACDLVLGPTEDGGYCLIAMREPHPELFQDMPWGSAEVADQTRRRASALGLRVAELATLWDVDDLEDWRRWQSSLGKN